MWRRHGRRMQIGAAVSLRQLHPVFRLSLIGMIEAADTQRPEVDGKVSWHLVLAQCD